MNLKLFFVFFVFLCSCTESKKILPNSTGSSSEIIFVVDDNIWEQQINRVVHRVFSSSIPGINKFESNFKVIQINNKEFTSLLKNHKNIVIVNDSINRIVSDCFAYNQLVSYLKYANDTTAFKYECNRLFKIYYDNEIQMLKSKLSASSNNVNSEYVNNRFNIDANITKEYTKTVDSNNVVLFTYNPSNDEVIKHIFITSFDYKESFNIDSIYSRTNKLLKNHLIGSRPNSYVALEDRYPLVMYNDFYRGLWRLQNGFMGGSVLIKPILNKNKIIIITALVFDPSSKKRKYIKEFEAIL